MSAWPRRFATGQVDVGPPQGEDLAPAEPGDEGQGCHDRAAAYDRPQKSCIHRPKATPEREEPVLSHRL